MNPKIKHAKKRGVQRCSWKLLANNPLPPHVINNSDLDPKKKFSESEGRAKYRIHAYFLPQVAPAEDEVAPDSMPHSSTPRRILKNPFSPQ
jgi:hypothetical protein